MAVHWKSPLLGRFDGIESITPAPVGDVEIEDLRAVVANENTILWGGIPGAMFSTPWTEQDIREQTRRLLSALWENGRLVVGSADQVPPDGNIDFCRVVADTIETICSKNSGANGWDTLPQPIPAGSGDYSLTIGAYHEDHRH